MLSSVVGVVAIIVVPLAGLVWAARRVRRRGGGTSLMGPFEEIWHPVAHQAHVEIAAQDERAAPRPGSPEPFRRS